MGQFYLDQDSAQFFNDGTESGSTSIASVNTNISVGNLGSPDKPFDTTILVRFLIQEYGGKAGSATLRLKVQKNGAGGYLSLGSVTGITAVDSSNLTQGDDCTQRIGSGTFVTDNNGVGDNGDTGSCSYGVSNESNVLFSFEIDEVDVNNGDYFDFEVYDNTDTAINSYTFVPRVTVAKTTPITQSVTQVTETDTAQPIVTPKYVTLTQVTETDTAQAITLPTNTIEVDLEEGDFSDFTSTDNSSNMSVSAGNALVGDYGLGITYSTTATRGNCTFSPSGNIVRFRVYFDLTGLTPGNGDGFVILHLHGDGTYSSMANIVLVYAEETNNEWAIGVHPYWDDTTHYDIPDSSQLSDAPHYLEVLYTRESYDGAADGVARAWLDGTELSGGYTNVENYNCFATIDEIRIGATTSLDVNTSGTFKMDDLIVREFNTEIGAAPGGGTPVVQVTETDTAQPIYLKKFIDVTQVTQTETAQPITSAKRKTVTQVTETDTSQSITALVSTAYLDFEEGDLSDFSATINSTDMAVNGTAAMVGSYGLDITLDGSQAATYGYKTFTHSTDVYVASFYINLNDLYMENGNEINLAYVGCNGAYNGYTILSYVKLGYNASGEYKFYLASRRDGGTWYYTPANIPSNPNNPVYIEIRYIRETTDSSNDGISQIFVNNELAGERTDLDNYALFATINSIAIGPYSGLETYHVGHIYYDEVIVRDFDVHIKEKYLVPSIVEETDTAQPITLFTATVVNQVTETDTAQPITSAKLKAVTQVTETNTAQPITSSKTKTVVQATESDTAQPIIPAIIRLVNQTTETDVSQPITFYKQKSIVQVTETDTSQAITSAKRLSITQVLETDLAQAITQAVPLTVAQVEETDTAQGLTTAKRKAIAIVPETNLAQPISIQKRLAIVFVPETDIAQPIVHAKQVSVTQITETDASQLLSPGRIYTLTQVTEADTVQSITIAKRYAIAQAIENDLAQPITTLGDKYVSVTQAIETDLSQPITFSKRKLVTLVPETSLAQAILSQKRRTVSQVTETDTSQPITVAKLNTISQVTETDTVTSILYKKIVTLYQVTETDTSQPITLLSTLLVVQVIDASLAQPITSAKAKTITQVLETNLAQAIALATGKIVQLSDTIGLTDTITTVQNYIRLLSTNLGISDTLSKVGTYIRLIQTSESISDTLTASVGIIRLISDTIGLTDLLSTIGFILVSIDDTIGITDTILTALDKVVLIQETLSMSDTLSRVGTYIRTISTELGIGDFLAPIGSIFVTIYDTIGISDTLTRILNPESLYRFIDLIGIKKLTEYLTGNVHDTEEFTIKANIDGNT